MGAKLALFLGAELLILHRDDKPGISWPGAYDFPGGGREGDESPMECAIRETHEEFGLIMPPSQICWARCYTNSIGKNVWFFVGWLPEGAREKVQFGEEGQGWLTMNARAYMAHENGVPVLQDRLGDYFLGIISELSQKNPPPN